MSAPANRDDIEASARDLREALDALGWSTAQLATLVHCNPRTARRWVDGTRPIPDYVHNFLLVSQDVLNKKRQK